ncbi:MAG: SRPBCC family protein [Mycobacteriales bacterium]
MKLENRFTVPVPRAEALKVLLDVERVAPCMPGATLTSRDGDAFTGTVKVKVGPINLTYGGKASFQSVDEQAGVVVIEAAGKETRGTGTAKALVTCRLVDNGGTTDVEVDTDLNITGKPAQFGRGVLAEVSGKLVDQFAANLSEEIRSGTQEAPVAPQAPAPQAPRVVREVEPIDLLGAAGTPVLKRVAPLLLLVLVVVLWFRHHRRR